jgi:hypothetical protein
MDYGKSGSPRTPRSGVRYSEHNAKGTDRNPFGKTAPKPELLARLKAAAAAKKQA